MSLLFITFLLIALVMLLCLVSPLMPSSVHSIVHTYTQTLSCLYTSDNPDNKRHPFLFFFSSLPFLHDLKKKMCFWIKERVCDLFCVMCKCCVSGLERKALKGFNAYQKSVISQPCDLNGYMYEISKDHKMRKRSLV